MLNLIRSCDVFYTPLSFHTEKSVVKAAVFILFSIVILFLAVKEIIQNIIISPKVNSILDLGEYSSSILKDYPPFKFNLTVSYYDKNNIISNEKCSVNLIQESTTKEKKLRVPTKINNFNYGNLNSSEFEILMTKKWFKFEGKEFRFVFDFGLVCNHQEDYKKATSFAKKGELQFTLHTNTYKMLKPNLQMNFADRNFNPIYSSAPIELSSSHGKVKSVKYDGLVHYIYDDLALFIENKKNAHYTSKLKPSLAEISFLNIAQEYKEKDYSLENIDLNTGLEKNTFSTSVIMVKFISVEVIGSNNFYLFIRKYDNVQVILSQYFSLIFIMREVAKVLFLLFDIKGKYFGLINSVVVMKYYEKETQNIELKHTSSSTSVKSQDDNSNEGGDEDDENIENNEKNGLLNEEEIDTNNNSKVKNKWNKIIKNIKFTEIKKDIKNKISKTISYIKDHINDEEISNENVPHTESLTVAASNPRFINSENINKTSKSNEDIIEPIKRMKSSDRLANKSNNSLDSTLNSSIKILTSNSSNKIQPLGVYFKKASKNSNNRKYKRIYFNEWDRCLLFCSCFSKKLKFKKEVFNKTQDSLRDFYHQYTSSEGNFLINSFVANTYKENIFNRVFKEFIWDDNLKKNKMKNNNNLDSYAHIANQNPLKLDIIENEDVSDSYIQEINRITLTNFCSLEAKNCKEEEFESEIKLD